MKKISEHDLLQADPDQLEGYRKWNIVWLNVFLLVYFHLSAFYGLYLLLTTCTWATVAWCVYLKIIGNIGASAGVHRLWSHNAFKAKLPLRILLMYFQSTCYQGPVYYWVRNHRLHHKFVDSDADPHNSRRGFFFSHMGWLIVRPNRQVLEKRAVVDLRDIQADSVVMFQKRHYLKLMPFFCFILPALVPWYFFGESFSVAWHTSMFRFVLNVHETFTINSFAHWFGARPYDKNICPTQNYLTQFATLGEGWHNYHHVFPYDYRSSEMYGDSLITFFIDMCAKIGWAYNLKSASEEMVARRRARTGENTKSLCDYKNPELKPVWGWGDAEMSLEEHNHAIKYNKLTDGYLNAK